MQAIILAGGFATRLWPLTEKKAKPLLYLQNKTLLTHIVEKIPPEIKIIISTNKIFEQDFLAWKKTSKHPNLEIFIEDSAEDKTKLGALGAVAFIIQQKQIKEDIMLFAGDNYFGFNFTDFIATFQNNPLLAAYDIKDKIQAKQFGVVVPNQDNTVKKFQEKPENPESTLVSTGAYLFPQKYLKDIIDYAKKKNDDLGGVFEYLQDKTKINIFTFKEPWFDIGSFQGYLEAHKNIEKNKQNIAKNIKIRDTELLGSISISDNCQIENSVLENVILFPNVKIKNCEIRNSIIDENCQIKNLDISTKIIRSNSILNNDL